MSSISFSLMYFHLPPLAFNFATSRPMYVAIPRLRHVSPCGMQSSSHKSCRSADGDRRSGGIPAINDKHLLDSKIPGGEDVHALQTKACKHL